MPDTPQYYPALPPESLPLPPEEELEVIVTYAGDLAEAARRAGAQAEELGGGFAILTLPAGNLPRLYGLRELLSVELPRPLSLNLNSSLRQSCAPPAQQAGETGLTGRGVLVGILDSGIDYTHPDFRTEDGGSRVLFLWDQGGTGTPPAGFRQGVQVEKAQLDAALAGTASGPPPPGDELGHGTAVAGIAAGSGRASGGRERGMAPEAELIVVKLAQRGGPSFFRTTELLRGVKYILDRAEELGRPVALNLSFGTNDGAHDGRSLFESYLDMAARRWRACLVVAAGNEGAARHHHAGRVGQGEEAEVVFALSQRLDSLFLAFWQDFSDRLTLELILPGGGSTGALNPRLSRQVFTLEGTQIQLYFGGPTHYNADREVFFSLRPAPGGGELPRGLWRLRVRGERVATGAFHLWLPTLEEVGQGATFSLPALETTLTLPSTAREVITVGGYQGQLDAAAPFSGRGYTRSNVYVKPDLAAPAVGILAPRTGGGYDAFSGTSMAAPFVTGAAALMMEWGLVRGNDPDLYGQRVKAFLRRGARRRNGVEYPNPLWGYGFLCLEDTLRELREL